MVSRIAPAIALVALLVSCAAPTYDDQTDKLVTQLQTDVDTEITTLMTLDEAIQDLSEKNDATSKAALAKDQTAAGWNANTGAYDKIAVDLLLLRPRVAAVRNWGTDSTLQSIDLLSANLVGSEASMRALHKTDGILRLDTLQYVQKIVGPQLDALVATEAQLKTGQSPSSGTGSNAKPNAGTTAGTTTGAKPGAGKTLTKAGTAN